jgi:hypothetical protein
MTSAGSRNAPLLVTAALIAVGLVLLVIGIIYFAEPARSLPSFFPGHAKGKHHHMKHGALAVVLGLVAFGGAWIASGRKRR